MTRWPYKYSIGDRVVVTPNKGHIYYRATISNYGATYVDGIKFYEIRVGDYSDMIEESDVKLIDDPNNIIKEIL